jgi:hypothetical protein
MVAVVRICRVLVCSTCQLALLVEAEGSGAVVAEIAAVIGVDTDSVIVPGAAAAGKVVGIRC